MLAAVHRFEAWPKTATGDSSAASSVASSAGASSAGATVAGGPAGSASAVTGCSAALCLVDFRTVSYVDSPFLP